MGSKKKKRRSKYNHSRQRRISTERILSIFALFLSVVSVFIAGRSNVISREANEIAISQSSDERVLLVQEQIRELEFEWLFTMEFFGWRKFRNQKEIGALSGLTPTPSQSSNPLDTMDGIGNTGRC